ncbi:hypothetical protein MASR2M15_04020 [Anaerolineales bacterium]
MSNEHPLETKVNVLDALKKQISMTEIGRMFGVSPYHIRQWEKGESQIRAEYEMAVHDKKTVQIQGLKEELLEAARWLLKGLEDLELENTPLQHRTSAIKNLLDHYFRIENIDLGDEKAEQVIRIEYKDSNGSIHDTPPWTRADYQPSGALPRGGVWETVREDGSGEDPADGGLATWSDEGVVDRTDVQHGQPGMARYEKYDAPASLYGDS